MKNNLEIIGRNAYVEFVGHTDKVPAKVDTGADSSAVWATDIRMDNDHHLHFVLFGKKSPFYTGKEIITEDYSVSLVRSSSGHSQIRYRATLSIRVNGRRVKTSFTLANRGENAFPILLGRRLLNGRFLVDVSQAECDDQKPRQTRRLNDELEEDPYAFYRKYHHNNQEDDKVKK